MNIDQILADHGFGGGTVVKGTAAAGDVLNSKTFMSATGKGLLTGSMPENGGVTITPGPNDISIPAGHHDGTGKVSKVVVNASHLLTGDTVAGTAGTMPNNGAVTITPSNADQAIPAGYHSGAGKVPAVTFDASKLLSGTTIAGTQGTMPEQGSPTLQPGQAIAPGHYSGGTVAQPAPANGSQTYSIAGTYTFTVPAGVTRILASVWGAGGGGSCGTRGVYGGWNMGGAGGGGGAFACEFLDVTPGQSLTITVGAGGPGGLANATTYPTAAGQAGGASSIGSFTVPGGHGGGDTTTTGANFNGGVGAPLPTNSNQITGFRGYQGISGNNAGGSPGYVAGSAGGGAAGSGGQPTGQGGGPGGGGGITGGGAGGNGGGGGASDDIQPAYPGGNGLSPGGGGGGGGCDQNYAPVGTAGGKGADGAIVLQW